MLKILSQYDPKECCGCRACECSCSHNAIKMETDAEGFLYPVVIQDKCVDCHLCEKVCPMHNAERALNTDGFAYATQNNNKSDLLTSSSGGMFVVIAKYVIGNGGIVYGAAYTDGTKVCHQRVVCEEELNRLKGSKYVQSDTLNTYMKVKKDLRDGNLVYFTGTPCQIAGLKLYLRKDYPTLVTSDLVCHGTPSNKIFNVMIKYMEQKLNAKFLDYSFRDKRTHGWACSSSSSYEKKHTGKMLYVKFSKCTEAFFKAFISGDLMRRNCYVCPFARYERTGDITIADYWNVKHDHPEFPNISYGVSLVLVNTPKGDELWKNISSEITTLSLTRDEALKSNWNLRHPTPLTSNRELSYKLAFDNYEDFIKKYYTRNYVKDKIKTELEYFVRKHERLFNLVSFIKRHI